MFNTKKNKKLKYYYDYRNLWQTNNILKCELNILNNVMHLEHALIKDETSKTKLF